MLKSHYAYSLYVYFADEDEGGLTQILNLLITHMYHHMGLYAFRRDFLLHYTTLPQTPLELTESLEQLRALEHDHRIRVCLTEHRTLEINTPQELAAAQHFNYLQD